MHRVHAKAKTDARQRAAWLILLLAVLGAAWALCPASSAAASALSSHAPVKAAVGRNQASQMHEDRSNILYCVGDSIVEGLHLREAAGFTLVNAGISGAGVRTFLHRTGNILPQAQGTTVLLAIGINDAWAFSAEAWGADYRELCMRLASGAAKFIVQTVLPLEKHPLWGGQRLPFANITAMNDIIRSFAKERGYCLIDMHAYFADKDGFMRKGATTDGVHLRGDSYAAWRKYWEQELPRCREGR
jgi:lysophospholipase L1-like esterase